MNTWISITSDIPEEGDLVEYVDYNGQKHLGFYTLPYRAYPNSFFDPFKFALWCNVDTATGNWYRVDIKPVFWRNPIKYQSEEWYRVVTGRYISKKSWFPTA